MDIIFFEQPLIGIAAIILIILDIVPMFIGTHIGLTIANGALHAVLLSYMFLAGGTFEEALLLVLVSASLALVQCPEPRKDGSKK